VYRVAVKCLEDLRDKREEINKQVRAILRRGLPGAGRRRGDVAWLEDDWPMARS
jgi:hypothetical protein